MHPTRQETLKATSECAQAAQRRAQQCFLSLIEGPVDPLVFVAKARYINPQVYSDVVEERAVAGLCGYPMCCNTFTDTYGSRTYVIRSNKVYDISKRRNFCSNVCYEASELVQEQVLTLPLYLRDTKDADIKDVRLPNLTKLMGRHGKLVDITGIENIEINDDEKPSRSTFMSVDEIVRDSLANLPDNDIEKNVQDKDSHKSDSNVDEKELHMCESQDNSKEEVVKNPLADVLKVESALRQWISFDSLRVILGDKYVRSMLEHCGRSWENYDTTSGMRLSVEAKAKYIALCRKLDHDEREEEEGQDTPDRHSEKQNEPRKPLPDYTQLQHDVKKQQLKVVSFLGGNDQYEVEQEKLDTIPEGIEEGTQQLSTKRKVKAKKPLQDCDAGKPTLPLVDSYSQAAWRQNIVIEKVNTYLQQMLEITNLSVSNIQKLVIPLVTTFHLSPSNITFQPKQWRLITLILLKLLSVRYQIIQDTLNGGEGLSMQRTIFSTYSLDLGYSDRVLSYLTEIKHILSKDFDDEKTEALGNENTLQNADITPQPCPGGALGVDTMKESVKSTDAQGLPQDMAQIQIKDNSVH